MCGGLSIICCIKLGIWQSYNFPNFKPMLYHLIQLFIRLLANSLNRNWLKTYHLLYGGNTRCNSLIPNRNILVFQYRHAFEAKQELRNREYVLLAVPGDSIHIIFVPKDCSYLAPINIILWGG